MSGLPWGSLFAGYGPFDCGPFNHTLFPYFEALITVSLIILAGLGFNACWASSLASDACVIGVDVGIVLLLMVDVARGIS